MQRIVNPELLDELPPDHPGALGSRKDLRRLNAVMRHDQTIARILQQQFASHLSIRIVELGAGDGAFLHSVARRLKGKWREVDALLVDRHHLLTDETRRSFEAMRWSVRVESVDVFDWLSESRHECDVIITNLFLHHFPSGRLQTLLAGCANRSPVLAALEPRRWKPALAVSHLVGLLGCNGVTRHDAVVSVRAGFTGRELSSLWPDQDNWKLTEQPAGWSSHLFIARRNNSAPAVSTAPHSRAVSREPATATYNRPRP